MRRRRRQQQFQVSMFPFLAVLLCAMGSLILLLFVFDRRAKAVARAKALAAIQKQEEEQERLIAERQAEFERRRQMLRAQLSRENQAVLTELHKVNKQRHRVEQEQSQLANRLHSLKESITKHQSAITAAKSRITSQRQALVHSEQKTRQADRDLLQREQELRLLESTLADLKEYKSRQTNLYSVVPYAGKYGDNRKPIYLECQADRVIFHPDRAELTTAAGIRAEVERRIEQRKSDASQNPRKAAYLFLLVRPDGIITYSQVMSALRDLQIDFGYELIDADWVLDFPRQKEPSDAQPWMKAKAFSTAKHPEIRRGNQSSADESRSESNASGGGGIYRGGRQTGTRNESGATFGSRIRTETRNGASDSPLARPVPTGSLPGSGQRGSLNGKETSKQLGGSNEASRSGRPNAVSNRDRPADVPKKPRPLVGLPQGRGLADVEPPEAPKTFPFIPRPEKEANIQNADGRPAASANGDANAHTKGQSGTDGSYGNQRGKPLVRPGWLKPDRDWIIVVECKKDEVVLRLTDQHFGLEQLRDGGNMRLVKAVKELIDARQRMVPPGVPPYRPILRFVVHADALRAYYLAFPALQPLKLPMHRVQVEE
ncbi:MAG: hypothetical protein KatS3mg105_2981 [Gemmatales bacterium]|nr:MAG: hypothetical protein KatS3mg105_2981 [Gemmatales bacterium]